MKRGWIVGGWAFAMFASALPSLWMTVDLGQRNPLGIYLGDDGWPTVRLVLQFFRWWLPVSVPVSLLALAAMALNRPAD